MFYTNDPVGDYDRYCDWCDRYTEEDLWEVENEIEHTQDEITNIEENPEDFDSIEDQQEELKKLNERLDELEEEEHKIRRYLRED